MVMMLAEQGAKVIIHHGHSHDEAERTRDEIQSNGGMAYILQADLNDHQQVEKLIRDTQKIGRISAIVNNAAIFDPINFKETDLDIWNRHININLTAPFLLSQLFASSISSEETGKIINIVDWRALRPQADHFPYTISKAGLIALTKSLAVALAPNIQVNGLALGAILPPSDGSATNDILQNVPANRWANIKEVNESLLFLLTGPEYITGEIIHIDGGRHLI
jgi:NAD(P)-dependent dehydrogenase (short-subunit alcohol dehydrogenase family)